MLPSVWTLRWWHARAVDALLLHVRCPVLARLSALERELLLRRKGTSRSLDHSCNTHVEPCLGKVALSSLVRVSLLLLLGGLLRSRFPFAEKVIRKLGAKSLVKKKKVTKMDGMAYLRV
jgi:hypothetical protein